MRTWSSALALVSRCGYQNEDLTKYPDSKAYINCVNCKVIHREKLFNRYGLTIGLLYCPREKTWLLNSVNGKDTFKL